MLESGNYKISPHLRLVRNEIPEDNGPDEIIQNSRGRISDMLDKIFKKRVFKRKLEELLEKGLCEEAASLATEKKLRPSKKSLIKCGDIGAKKFLSLSDQDPDQPFEKNELWAKRAVSAYFEANETEKILILAEALIDRGFIHEGRYFAMLAGFLI